MLPRASSVKQMKKLRKQTKGDIGDITKYNKSPNLTFIGNPMDKHIDTYEEFTIKDSQLQTIAFKSKLVNKPLVKNENEKDMSDKIKNLLNFEDFDKETKTEKLPTPKSKRTDVTKDVIKEKKQDKTLNFTNFLNEDIHEIEELEELASDDDEFSEDESILDDEESDDESDKLHTLADFSDLDEEELDEEELEDDDEYKLDDDEDYTIIRHFDFNDDENEKELEDDENEEELEDDENEEDDVELEDEVDGFEDEEDTASNFADLYNDVLKFESFHLKEVTPKKKEMPKYTMLGEEQELESDPNFGVAAVKDKDNKKIAWFNTVVIDPPTPKERSILNAGQFIDNDIVKGYVNRIEGKNVYVESLDDPLTIKKFSIKDAIKIKKSE